MFFDVTLNEGGGPAKILLLLVLNRSATDDDDDDDGGLISVEDLMIGFGFAMVENKDASAEVEVDEPNRSEAAVNDVGLIGILVNIFLEFASLNKS